VIRTKIPLTEDEVSKILEEAGKRKFGKDGSPNNADASLRDHAAICLMYYGGLRVSETTNLRISDLDLDKKKLRVHGGKGNDYSMVNLTDEAVASIRDYLDRGRPTPRKPEYADYLILSIRGSPMKGTHLWPRVKKAAFGAGIEKNVSPHIFRHSMITHMAEKGISASLIQAQSRHKSLDMVQRYTHLSEPVVREAYDHAFSKTASHPAVVQNAQEQSVSPKTSSSRDKDEDRKGKLMDLYLAGKIADDRFDKLLSMMDRTIVNKPVIAGYV
jgi:site-specific recombinase XerD